MPNWGNNSLRKYEDKYYTTAYGKVSFSASWHDFGALEQRLESEIEGPVRKSADGLVYRIRSRAPCRYGTLRDGLMANPQKEKSKKQGKVVNDIVFDARMNDSFVKMSKAGKRYYYPASQEYGFITRSGGYKYGLYYMRNASIDYYSEHESTVVASVVEILEDL